MRAYVLLACSVSLALCSYQPIAIRPVDTFPCQTSAFQNTIGPASTTTAEDSAPFKCSGYDDGTASCDGVGPQDALLLLQPVFIAGGERVHGIGNLFPAATTFKTFGWAVYDPSFYQMFYNPDCTNYGRTPHTDYVTDCYTEDYRSISDGTYYIGILMCLGGAETPIKRRSSNEGRASYQLILKGDGYPISFPASITEGDLIQSNYTYGSFFYATLQPNA